MEKPIILCERCIFSSDCMRLKPCKDFAPELNSNFLLEVKKLIPVPEDPVYSF